MESLTLKANKYFTCVQNRKVAIGHWETLNGHGEKVRLVRQHISAKCQESPSLKRGEYVKSQAKSEWQ